jgi:hypothetical protein
VPVQEASAVVSSVTEAAVQRLSSSDLEPEPQPQSEPEPQPEPTVEAGSKTATEVAAAAAAAQTSASAPAVLGSSDPFAVMEALMNSPVAASSSSSFVTQQQPQPPLDALRTPSAVGATAAAMVAATTTAAAEGAPAAPMSLQLDENDPFALMEAMMLASGSPTSGRSLAQVEAEKNREYEAFLNSFG